MGEGVWVVNVFNCYDDEIEYHWAFTRERDAEEYLEAYMAKQTDRRIVGNVIFIPWGKP